VTLRVTLRCARKTPLELEGDSGSHQNRTDLQIEAEHATPAQLKEPVKGALEHSPVCRSS
jgi:hypothetical protein